MDAEMSLVWPCPSPACAHDIDADVSAFLTCLGWPISLNGALSLNLRTCHDRSEGQNGAATEHEKAHARGGGGLGSRESDEQNGRKGTFTMERENGSVREANVRNACAKYEGGREWGWKLGRSTGKGTVRQERRLQ